jgi:hypothetical protein
MMVFINFTCVTGAYWSLGLRPKFAYTHLSELKRKMTIAYGNVPKEFFSVYGQMNYSNKSQKVNNPFTISVNVPKKLIFFFLCHETRENTDGEEFAYLQVYSLLVISFAASDIIRHRYLNLRPKNRHQIKSGQKC